MGKTDELEKAATTITDSEKRLAHVQHEVYNLDQEIRHLETMVEMLQANIKCLKKNRIIAMAREFKKAKNDLETANNRVNLLKKDRDAANKAIKHTELFIRRAKENHARLLRSFDNNVVRGNFRSRNNGS
jgi:chromosome segregation ATPase